MAKQTKEMDKLFLGITITLVVVGLFVFISASLGLYAQQGLSLMAIATRQFLLGVVGGLGALWLFSRIPYSYWKRFALPLFILSLGATALVFVPSFGYSHGGATRWIEIGSFSFQPVELLKVGFVICFAAWCAYAGKKIKTWLYGVLPFVLILALVVGILFLQPDTGSVLVIGLTAIAMFIAAGARWTHIAALAATGAAGLASLAYVRPYIQERLLTFLNPATDPLGAGYQIKQSLIAVGSGKWFGRGFGQSIQKFNFVPEPVGDSIFAIFAEEWGFFGSVVLIALFIAFALRGYKIAADAKNPFAQLLVVGLVTLIAVQSFVNIAAMIGILPLTGLPLIFVSHGGTALFVALASVGIILNVSRST
jgi:cell division protein FtsW